MLIATSSLTFLKTEYFIHLINLLYFVPRQSSHPAIKLSQRFLRIHYLRPIVNKSRSSMDFSIHGRLARLLEYEIFSQLGLHCTEFYQKDHSLIK
jgi:hypothetical protein